MGSQVTERVRSIHLQQCHLHHQQVGRLVVQEADRGDEITSAPGSMAALRDELAAQLREAGVAIYYQDAEGGFRVFRLCGTHRQIRLLCPSGRGTQVFTGI